MTALPLPPSPAANLVKRVRAAELDPVSLLHAGEPVVIEGLVGDWPLVAAGRDGDEATARYLEQFDAGRPVVAYHGAPAIRGRFFYDADVRAMNFTAERVPLAPTLARICAAVAEPDPPSFYIGSTDLDGYLPGLRQANPLPVSPEGFGPAGPTVSIWIGNRTVAATHYDMSNNIACCAVGRRRFTLFPPDQVGNLYPGPLEPTPGGQVVSMVDLAAPDLDRYPRFVDALAAAQVADLAPGDVLFYPALWWHNVEALDAFNVMINCWWNNAPSFLDTPMNMLLQGILSLRDRPAAEKQAWRSMLDHYVFGPAEQAAAHLPVHAQGALAPLDDRSARRLRAQLLGRLNR